MLNEPETPYLAYLIAKTTKLDPYLLPKIKDSDKHRESVQNAMLADKYLVDKSQDAFVSYLRYYKEH